MYPVKRELPPAGASNDSSPSTARDPKTVTMLPLTLWEDWVDTTLLRPPLPTCKIEKPRLLGCLPAVAFIPSECAVKVRKDAPSVKACCFDPHCCFGFQSCKTGH